MNPLQQLIALSDDEKQGLADQLRQAGLAVSAPSEAWSADAERACQQQLKMKEGQAIDPDRALGLLASLAEMASSMDQFAGTAWHTLSGKSGSPPRSQMKEAMASCLANEGEASLEQVREDIDKLRQLAAAVGQSVASSTHARPTGREKVPIDGPGLPAGCHPDAKIPVYASGIVRIGRDKWFPSSAGPFRARPNRGEIS